MRKTVFPYHLMALVLLVIFFSCKKDTMKTAETDNPPKLAQANITSKLNALSTAYPTASNNNDSVETPTIIDYQLPNPYTIANMQQAYKRVTGQSITPAVTNLYVKFKPSDAGQLRVLDSTAESQGLELFDEPLDYHIVQEGDYYQDPSIPMEQITWQYAVVPPTFSFPAGIQYQILASIHIPTDMSVEAEAERLVGLNADGDDYNAGAAAAAGSQTQTATATIQPNVLQCGVGYHWDFTVNKCVPDNCASGYHWDNTKQTCVPDAPPPPPPSYIPGGRIRVWDSQLDGTPPASALDPGSIAQPLRTARVIAKRWFKIDRTFTDNNGAFQVTKNFRNKAKLYVKFQNQYTTIRAMRGFRVWQLLLPLRRKIGAFTSSSINTINYTFLQGSTVRSIGTRFWSAATTLNANQEHKDYATQFGFSAAPINLNIYLTSWAALRGLASTPLFHQRNYPNLPTLFSRTFIFNSNVNSLPVSEQYLVALLGLSKIDMAIDYRSGNSLANPASDDLKETIYHESSHASHYSKIGVTAYTSFVDAEINQIIAHPPGDPLNPYGPNTSPDAPLIAVGEGWAYHVGHFLADQRYGTAASCTSEQTNANGFGIDFCPNAGRTNHPHIDVLEQFNPNLSTDPFNWIPKGLMEDLMDATNEAGNPVIDQVAGFTIQQLFNPLQSDVTTPQQYRDRLIQQNPNNQTAQITNLFTQYHY